MFLKTLKQYWKVENEVSGILPKFSRWVPMNESQVDQTLK